MKQQHHPTDLKSFEKGINSDMNKELLGTKAGEHVDAKNMRSLPMDGDNFAKKKIKGEEVVYPNIDNRCLNGTGQPLSENYECMMTQEINGHIVEAWATDPDVDPQPSLMRINGKIVLMSNDFPIRVDYPLQYDKNETCVGGEFYITDNLNKPMVFNVKDLLVNSGVDVGGEIGICTPKYFDSFNLSLYVVGVSSSLFKMSFITQPTNVGGNFDVVFGSEGLLVGMYSYSYRYVTEEGDRSGWSPITELIPVIRGKQDNDVQTGYNNPFPSPPYPPNYPVPPSYEPSMPPSTSAYEFPKAGNYGGFASPTSPTTYGNHLVLKYDNKNKFEYIEVRRDGWYSGSTLNYPPVSDIIGSFPISGGLNVVNILDYASSGETEEPLTEADLLESPEQIERAKSVRYFNSKLYLMNIKYKEKDIDASVSFVDGDPIFPTIEKMGKKGHIDTYNATYYKSTMRGEANGFGVVIYDDAGARTYATSVIDNFEFPNRRDPVSSETLGNSYFGVVSAADTNGNAPNFTHEVFDHADAVGRAEVPGEEIVVANNWGSDWNQLLISNVSTAPGEKPNLVNLVNNQSAASLFGSPGPYKALRPVSQTDPYSTYNRRINTNVFMENGINKLATNYNPKAFGIDYYAMGASFRGLETDTLPEWADGFSVVQTAPANRVIAQGLGFYSLIDSPGGFAENGGKQAHELLCNFPDLDPQTGIIPEKFNELIGTHGSDSPYRLQLVSPLGFFSEFYSYYSKAWEGTRRAIDAIAYCRILKDSGGSEGINPVWDGVSALNDYVGFGGWREAYTNAGTVFNNAPSNMPNYTNPNYFTIVEILEEPTATLSETNIRIVTQENVYNQEYTSGAADNAEFDLPGLTRWHEPMYVVNIVRVGAQINPGLLTEYKYTGNYIKLKSKILTSDGSASQSATLVSERWEDCTQQIQGQVYNDYSSLERFVWVENSNGVEQRWLDVTSKTPAQVGAIQSNIVANGFDNVTDTSGTYQIYGTYTVAQTFNDSAPIFTLTFEGLLAESEVYVKYDNRIPVRVFGGDTYINDDVFPVLDFEYNSKGKPINDTHKFKFNVPFPYPMYQLNPYIGLAGDVSGNTDSLFYSRYLTSTKASNGNVYYGTNIQPGLIYFDGSLYGGGGDTIEDDGFRPSRWRQLVAMWTAETRINLSFAFNNENPKTNIQNQFFPLKNYIYRPGRWKEGDVDELPPGNSFTDDNNIHDDYYTDYGKEWINWGKGGFRFREPRNIDYSKRQTTEIITSVPALGFEEEIEFCTRVVWSVTRPINVQDTPTVKTFLPNNFKDISDDTGEIKFAWDGDSDKGNNLYAITNNGICLLLVDKRILSEINSNELATIGSDIGGISRELWIDKEIGMDKEMWRSWAEYSNTLFWVNETSSYSFINNQVKDLGSTGYRDLLRREWLTKSNGGVFVKMSGTYDILHKEYYANVNNRGQSGNTQSTLIFGVTQDALQCQSDYDYEKYLAVNNKMYGMKGMQTFELGVGNILNGEEYECYVAGVSDKDTYLDKEFIRIRVNSKSKPKRIEFFDNYDEYKAENPSSIVDATADPINIKDYFGYECYIPRKAFAPYNRQQGRLVIFRVVSDDDENFFISTAGIQYKALK